MRIKKIIANSIKEGQDIVERELGKEAIILSSRNAKLPNGSIVVEIVAALDDKTILNNKSDSDNKVNLYNNSATFYNNSIKKKDNTELKEFIDKIKDDFSYFSHSLAELSENIKYKYTGTMPEPLAKVYKILRNSDVSEELSLNIIGRISAKGLFGDYKKSLDEAQKLLLEHISFANPVMQSSTRQIVAFYGTTGCGKTMSLIKLAVICKLIYKQNVLIVSADTHKIGGIEQLQTLASVTGIAFKAAYNATELKDIVTKETNYNLVMVDTAGCNPNEKNDMTSLEEYHNNIKPDLKFLVLNATTSKSVLINTIEQFTKFGINSTIITKVDEAIGLGNIISALEMKKLPISYFATGKKIPEDFELATYEKLNDYLLMV